MKIVLSIRKTRQRFHWLPHLSHIEGGHRTLGRLHRHAIHNKSPEDRRREAKIKKNKTECMPQGLFEALAIVPAAA